MSSFGGTGSNRYSSHPDLIAATCCSSPKNTVITITGMPVVSAFDFSARVSSMLFVDDPGCRTRVMTADRFSEFATRIASDASNAYRTVNPATSSALTTLSWSPPERRAAICGIVYLRAYPRFAATGSLHPQCVVKTAGRSSCDAPHTKLPTGSHRTSDSGFAHVTVYST
jgi:hypothetical protein